MPTSQIIKDLANNNTVVSTSLKRAKVLFSKLGNDDLLRWINFEIEGYPSDVSLPDYRVMHGALFGSYIKGSMVSHIKYTNVPLPLGKMPAEIRDQLLSVSFRDGISALQQLIDDHMSQTGVLGKSIPADLFPIISECNNDPFMCIHTAQVNITSQSVTNIISTVENRLLNSLILLENSFGCLDDLDLDVATKTPEEIIGINKQLVVLVLNDHRITIGDNNHIKQSTIASTNGELLGIDDISKNVNV